LHDPGVAFGRYKLLPVTDGRWALHDTRAPLGAGALFFATRELAVQHGERLTLQHPGVFEHD
jgi:hypothetical protein